MHFQWNTIHCSDQCWYGWLLHRPCFEFSRYNYVTIVSNCFELYLHEHYIVCSYFLELQTAQLMLDDISLHFFSWARWYFFKLFVFSRIYCSSYHWVIFWDIIAFLTFLGILVCYFWNIITFPHSWGHLKLSILVPTGTTENCIILRVFINDFGCFIVSFVICFYRYKSWMSRELLTEQQPC